MTPKKRLGRGLDALLSKPVAETAAVTGEHHEEASGEGLRQIPVTELQGLHIFLLGVDEIRGVQVEQALPPGDPFALGFDVESLEPALGAQVNVTDLRFVVVESRDAARCLVLDERVDEAVRVAVDETRALGIEGRTLGVSDARVRPARRVLAGACRSEERFSRNAETGRISRMPSSA